MTDATHDNAPRLSADDRVRLERILHYRRPALWAYIALAFLLLLMSLIWFPWDGEIDPAFVFYFVWFTAIVIGLSLRYRFQRQNRQALADDGFPGLANVKRRHAGLLLVLGLSLLAVAVVGYARHDADTMRIHATWTEALMALMYPAICAILFAIRTHAHYRWLRYHSNIPADDFRYVLPKQETQ